ncbi:helix-turn-helix domain-containing protein [Actinacidiphila sp. bgisy160]|uniref:helix-turn-helix domain-containing protein n=1 Tax=Actinacidiphila sp. bgisy160 TaxID=3413796 RepID=UPI003D75308A
MILSPSGGRPIAQTVIRRRCPGASRRAGRGGRGSAARCDGGVQRRAGFAGHGGQGLAGRGPLGADGAATAAGRDAHRALEEATDRAAGRPWEAMGP